jgi:hypothetical protein
MSITAIKIDAVAKTVTRITMEDTLEDFYPHIGCRCMEAVRVEWFSGTDVLLVDEDGLRDADSKEFFAVAGWGPQPIAGNGVIVGYDAEGETISCVTPLHEVQARVSFLWRLG